MWTVNDATFKLIRSSLVAFNLFSAHRAKRETKLDQLRLHEDEKSQADEEARKFVKEELKQLYSMAQEANMSGRESGQIVVDLVEKWILQSRSDGGGFAKASWIKTKVAPTEQLVADLQTVIRWCLIIDLNAITENTIAVEDFLMSNSDGKVWRFEEGKAQRRALKK
jgi:hypothetical protein